MNFVNNRILNFISLCSITGLDFFYLFLYVCVCVCVCGGGVDVPVRFISFRHRKI